MLEFACLMGGALLRRMLSGLACLLLLLPFFMSGNQAVAGDGHRKDKSKDHAYTAHVETDDEDRMDSGKSNRRREWHEADDVLPTANISGGSVVEGLSGKTRLIFAVTLSGLADGHVDVRYATVDGTARAGADYSPVSGTLTIPAGSTTAIIKVDVKGESVPESDETLIMTLFSPSGNLLLGSATATGTIINDDVSRMNDTGITILADAVSLSPAVATSVLLGQDAAYGRDADPFLNSNADGRAGFTFTKLDSTGAPLADQTAIYSITPWDCVQDNVTGLMWEVKTPAGAGGLRDSTYEYSWYNSDPTSNGGFAGGSNLGICADTVNCDTEKFVAAVNAVALCGYTDWRMPGKEELNSIKDYGVSTTGFSIDLNYFPNTFKAWYWSATSAAYPVLVWGVGFSYPDNTGLGKKDWIDHVRLVRDGGVR